MKVLIFCTTVLTISFIGKVDGAEHLGSKSVSMRARCVGLLDLLKPNEDKIRFGEAELKSIQTLYNALYRSVGEVTSPSYELLTSELVKNDLALQQWYHLWDKGVPIRFSSRGPLGLVSFYFEEYLPPHQYLQFIAKGKNREYGRWIIHFKNGDTFSGQIDAGEKNRIRPVGLYSMLSLIEEKGVKTSSGYSYQFSDIVEIEYAHTHPKSSLVRISSENGHGFWSGSMGESTADRKFRSEILPRYRQVLLELSPYFEKITFSLSIVSSQGLVLKFPGG